MHTAKRALCLLLVGTTAACSAPMRHQAAEAPDAVSKSRYEALAWVREEYSHDHRGFNDLRRDMLRYQIDAASLQAAAADEEQNAEAWQRIEKDYGVSDEDVKKALAFLEKEANERDRWRLHADTGENDGDQALVFAMVLLIAASAGAGAAMASSNKSASSSSSSHRGSSTGPNPSAMHGSGGAHFSSHGGSASNRWSSGGGGGSSGGSRANGSGRGASGGARGGVGGGDDAQGDSPQQSANKRDAERREAQREEEKKEEAKREEEKKEEAKREEEKKEADVKAAYDTCVARMTPETEGNRSDAIGPLDLRSPLQVAQSCDGKFSPCARKIRDLLNGNTRASNMQMVRDQITALDRHIDKIPYGPWSDSKPNCSVNFDPSQVSFWCWEMGADKKQCADQLSGHIDAMDCATKLAHWVNRAEDAANYQKYKEDYVASCRTQSGYKGK